MDEVILNPEPFMSYYYKLFTDQECNDVIEYSKKEENYYRSLNFSHELKAGEITDFRTSDVCLDRKDKFLFMKERIYEAVKDRFWYIDNFNINHFDHIQILRYKEGQQYKPHFDFFNMPDKHATDNDRIATAILYLNDDFSGGETKFPELGRTISPEKGSLLYFEYKYLHDLNIFTRHQGMPVTKGIKYIISFWIRANPNNSPVTITDFNTPQIKN
jgi:prolyl 4-hydroxylase